MLTLIISTDALTEDVSQFLAFGMVRWRLEYQGSQSMSDGQSQEIAPVSISEVPAYGQAIGMAVHHIEGKQITLKVPYAQHLVGDPDTGVLHGGVITAALDNASGWAIRVIRELDQDDPMATGMATLDIRIDYMKPASPGEELFVTAECYKRTQNIAFVRASAFHTSIDDPVATSVATFMMGTPNQPRT